VKIKQIMNTFFEVCSPHDRVGDILYKIMNLNTEVLIVIDSNMKYKGTINAISIIQAFLQNKEQTVMKAITPVEVINEDENISCLTSISAKTNYIPVVNRDNNVVGCINLNSLVNNINFKCTNLNIKSILKCNTKYSTKYSLDSFIGKSGSLNLLKKRLRAAAKSNATVLIMGETGTGKELVAHAITNLSSRRQQPFIRINCAAIPDNLLEAELFGYEEGSFTGAIKGGTKGKFLQANNGTIFLDEIGDMPLQLQAKILRVLQEKEIERIGTSYPIPIDVRIIAATHANLEELIKKKKFREDLYYRLYGIPINVPTLRERKEDIHLLVDYYIDKFCKEMNIEKPKVDLSFIMGLVNYDWPGNIRQLMNVIQMAISFSDGTITDNILHEYVFQGEANEETKVDHGLKSIKAKVEKDRILKAIQIHGGNRIEAAKTLGISRSNLYSKIKKYNI